MPPTWCDQIIPFQNVDLIHTVKIVQSATFIYIKAKYREIDWCALISHMTVSCQTIYAKEIKSKEKRYIILEAEMASWDQRSNNKRNVWLQEEANTNEYRSIFRNNKDQLFHNN